MTGGPRLRGPGGAYPSLNNQYYRMESPSSTLVGIIDSPMYTLCSCHSVFCRTTDTKLLCPNKNVKKSERLVYYSLESQADDPFVPKGTLTGLCGDHARDVLHKYVLLGHRFRAGLCNHPRRHS